jgi:serine/threonine protein kinase
MSVMQFIVVAGPDKDKRYVIHEGDGLMMGRHPETAYQLNDPRVSRNHCEVRCKGGKVTVIDNKSAGGTFVNSAKITQRVLQHGDLVQLGESLLRYDSGSAVPASTVTGLQPHAEYDAKATEQLNTLSGRKLAHFEIGPVIGKGDSHMSFQATDTKDNKTVSLRVMQPAFSKDEDEIQRFIRAVKTMLPLRHPNIVALYGAGKNGPYCWISMEYIEGELLTDVIHRIGIAGMLDWKHAYRVGVHIGRALEYAHGLNIIHRSIAPATIIIQASDKAARLNDLMLAKALEGTLAQEITKPGELVGDVNYLSPERTRGVASEVDGRSDLFSLGSTCYALLTGKPPFAGKTLVETITKIRNVEPIKPSQSQLGIPGLFEAVILKMLAKRPEERYQTAGEVVKELERIGKFQGVTA